MGEDLTSDFVRRERVTDALLEFDRRIRERVLPVSDSECWDVVLNRPPAPRGEAPGDAADPLPLRYETRDEVSLLRVIDGSAPNRACLQCDLFGRSHCGGGLVFLYYALRDAGVPKPMEWLAVEIEPGLYLPDWEAMEENSRRIARKLRDYFEAHLKCVSADPKA
ncbi:MAG TPA: hypothetical protein PLA43_05790 [Bryobacteraceae bacterium]|nr:hypothetical protein [Bryobacteraceae bacterium]HOL71933.1 hypothetical protein [Bryobacteraceae bacterium]HOQ45240.1 hypothetical protein [Bryobacteraceae bacterium]HPQ14516.1 hypothetical protein [Bryobacteraceae bacterium]HPU71448.1 hypothetical protein [Bryobacteraceae bacterium]